MDQPKFDDFDDLGRYVKERGEEFSKLVEYRKTKKHIDNCCSVHGCYFGEKTCCVVSGERTQSYMCGTLEQCKQ